MIKKVNIRIPLVAKKKVLKIPSLIWVHLLLVSKRNEPKKSSNFENGLCVEIK